MSTGALRERLRAAELAKGNTAVAATSPGNADALRGAALRHVDIINRHWAGTSSDSNQYAIAGQIAAAQEFGLGDAAMKRLKATVTGGGYGSKAGQDAWDEAQKLMSVPGVAETYRVALRAMYENTQAEFKAKGITHVTLERGMTVDVMALPKATRDALGTLTKGDAYNSPKYVPKVGALATAPIAMQPASSFAPDHATAELFTHGGSHEGSVGIILKGSVPVSRILGTARTGMGCLNEYEYVMLETKGQFEVQIGRQNMSVTMPDQP